MLKSCSTTYRNFDLMSQLVKLRQLKVTGSEKVTVPAGSLQFLLFDSTSA